MSVDKKFPCWILGSASENWTQGQEKAHGCFFVTWTFVTLEVDQKAKYNL